MMEYFGLRTSKFVHLSPKLKTNCSYGLPTAFVYVLYKALEEFYIFFICFFNTTIITPTPYS